MMLALARLPVFRSYRALCAALACLLLRLQYQIPQGVYGTNGGCFKGE
jgi:hypothetical protein